jgi:hypothetical protein
MSSRTASGAARRNDDHGVAGVVGFVLILAAAITAYSYAAQNEVPKRGAQNEEAWMSGAGSSLASLAHAAGAQAGAGTSPRALIAAPPDAPSQTIPFLAPIRSAKASGALSFDPDCGGATLAHAIPSSATAIVDLADAAKGCVKFDPQPAYAERTAYLIENGGILRLQGDKAFVVAGPGLTLENEPGKTTAAITLVSLSGAAQSLGVDAEIPIGLTPRMGSLEVVAPTNAMATTWTFTTSQPAAWLAWFQQQIDASGASGATVSQTGPQTIEIHILGDNTQPLDVSLSVSYGRYDVSLG